MKCNCECHKEQDKSDLKKCQDQNKKKTKEINQLRQKLMVATIAIAIVGTLVSKQAFDYCIEYFQKYDQVKQAIDGVSIKNTGDSFEILPPVYYGVSPSPSTLSVLALSAMIPTPRRR